MRNMVSQADWCLDNRILGTSGQVFFSDNLIVDTTDDFGKPYRDDIPSGGDVIAHGKRKPDRQETDTGPNRGKYYLNDPEAEGSQEKTDFTQ